MNTLRRNRQSLSESLGRHVNAYTLAAGAAGVAIIALAPLSEGEIIYTKAHTKIPYNRDTFIDLNHDGIPDFRFFFFFSPPYKSWYANLSVRPIEGGVIATAGGAGAFPLPRGASIGPSQDFADRQLRIVGSGGFGYGSHYERSFVGPWANVQNRFLGVEFVINEETHYGWIRLSVIQVGVFPVATVVTGYAYETVANRNIFAGQLSDETGNRAKFTPMKQPSLGSLALGQSGLSLWRREESSLAA